MFNRAPSRRLSASTIESRNAAPIEEFASFTPTSTIGLIRQPAILAVAFAFFGYSYVLFFFLTWFPSYLVTAKHMTMQDMSLVSAIPWALGAVGLATGGLLSDRMSRVTGDPVSSRKLILVSSLGIAAIGVALAGLVESPAAAITVMGIALFFMYLSGSQYFVIVLDLIPGPHVGTVTGFVHFAANCAGILAPLITGFIISSSGSFVAAFALAGTVASLGAVSVGILVRTQSDRSGGIKTFAG
jgi:MFS family permease